MARGDPWIEEKSIAKTLADGSTKVYLYRVMRWIDPKTGRKRSKPLGRGDDPKAKRYIGKRDARAVARDAASEFRRRPGQRGEAPALEKLLRDFQRLKKAEGREPATLAEYEYVGRLLAAHFGGRMRVDRITAEGAFEFWTTLCSGELGRVNRGSRPAVMGQQTAAKHLRAVRAIFRHASEGLEVISRNPFAKIKRPAPKADATWQYVDADDFWKLYNHVSPPWQRVIALARLSSLSREDILLLDWSRVHLEEQEIRIKRAKTDIRQHAPIDPTLRDLLVKWRGQRTSLKLRGDPVVPAGSVYLGNVGRSFRSWCDAAGVDYYGKPLHTLRKSCILDWVRLQPSAQVVRVWAGHSSIETTLTFYDQVRAKDMDLGKHKPLIEQPPVVAPTLWDAAAG